MCLNSQRKFFTLLLVLLLVCSSCFAFPGREKRTQKVPEEPIKQQTAELLSITESSSAETQDGLKNLQQSTTDVKLLSDDQLIEEVIATAKNVVTHANNVILDSEDKAATIEELAALNSKQADEIASIKPIVSFFKIGATLGFKELQPQLGINSAVGFRLYKELFFEFGANYMLGSLKSPTFEKGLDNLQLSASFVYMFK